MTDDQAVMDQEDAAVFRAAVKKLSSKVRKALAEEGRCKAAAKEARKERGYADSKLARLTEGDDDQAGDWLSRMASASRRAESAQEQETEARQEWVRAVFARRKAQDELRVRVRKQFEEYPLIDGAAAWNGDGHAETPPAEESQEPEDLYERTRRKAIAEAEAKIAEREATEPVCGSEGPDGTACIHLSGHHGAHRWEKPPDVSPTNIPPADPLAVACHKGQNKQTCPDRGKAADPEPTPRADATLFPDAARATCTVSAGDGTACDREAGHAGGHHWTYPFPHADYDPASLPPAEADPEEPPRSAEGWIWPVGLTEGVLRKACVDAAVSRVNRLTPKPATAHPFEWDGQLWVCVSVEPDASVANVLPLIPAKDFEERYPQYPTSYYPDRAKLSLPATDEGRVQWWTGVVLKVGRKEYAIATAGEMRTLAKPTGDAQ